MAGIYIHIPYCKSKCIYCDFFSVGMVNPDFSRYIDCVIREFQYRKGELGGEDIKTLYIGGGTPSLIPVMLIDKISKAFEPLGTIEEFTIEVNPDDVTEEYADSLSRTSVNRVSMGVQSFDDEELRLLGRRHNSKGAVDAVDRLKKSGFSNISIDLIYGIPGQSLESWRKSVDMAIAMDVPHISAYGLTYEDGTRLMQMLKKGVIREAADEVYVEMFEVLCSKLREAGYEHYEISNFARPGMHSRHNSAYWDFTPYIGLGPSAHSFDGKLRRYNPVGIRKYIDSIEEKGYAYSVDGETDDELYNEWVMTRLRTSSGLDLADLRERFGDKYYKSALPVVERYRDEGCVAFDGDKVTLTEAGMLVSDMIFRDLFMV